MGIALNEDNSQFYFTRPGQPVTLGTVDALVDQYAGTQVFRLLFCPNCMRTSYEYHFRLIEEEGAAPLTARRWRETE